MRGAEQRIDDRSAGFPWLAALPIYAASWGWSLLRPNSLYWDDWLLIFGKPKSYLNEHFVKTGLPPWRALVDQQLLGVGYWTVRWLTFIMFFFAALFLFEILKAISFVTQTQRHTIVLLFLIVPVNHARIALVMFGYTTSYFLFFLAWMLIVRRSSWSSFLVGCIAFMWSFMTHSLLFFLILPLTHFVILRHDQLTGKSREFKAVIRLGVLFALPMLYLVFRFILWKPIPEYEWYHTIHLRAFLVACVYLAPAAVLMFGFRLQARRGRQTSATYLLISAGFLALGIAVFPYVMSGNLDTKMTFLFWQLEWTSRHQLLMPLGVSLIITAILSSLSTRWTRSILVAVLTVSSVLNIYWGVQGDVASLKKNELEHLLSFELQASESKSFVFIDETRHFNFRNGSYRRYEYVALLTKIGRPPTSSVADECGEDPNQTKIVIKSNNGLWEALLQQDLGLELIVEPCE